MVLNSAETQPRVHVGETTHPGEVVPIEYPGKTVYNPTVKFLWKGEWYCYGRSESRHIETDSEIVAYRQLPNQSWEIVPGAPSYRMQDPFIKLVHGKWILGGVEVKWDGNAAVDWPTVLRVGDTPFGFEPLARGPSKMKDIRLVGLPDGRVGYSTRPQCGIYGRGKIGFGVVDSLEELKHVDMEQTPLLPDIFGDENWGGTNELWYLSSGLIGAIAHYASFVGESKKYEAYTLEFHPYTREIRKWERLAGYDDFPIRPPKYDMLRNVVFPAGIYQKNGVWKLFCGVSDAYIGEKVIDYPFSAPPLDISH